MGSSPCCTPTFDLTFSGMEIDRRCIGHEKGFVTRRVTAFAGFSEVGYVQVAWIPASYFQTLKPWEIHSFWTTSRVATYGEHRESSPHKKVEVNRWFNEHARWFGDKPFVDISHVHDPYKRLGIGTALYRETARQLGQMGMPMYASTLQSESAVALWRRITCDPAWPVFTEETRLSHKIYLRRGIDLRP